MKITRICSVLVSALLVMASLATQAQGVGINETQSSPDGSAILDVSSTDKGILIPRMPTTDRDNIGNPAEGLLIFNTTTKCFESFVLGAWNNVSCPGCIPPSSAGEIAGSASVCPGTPGNVYSISAVNGATGYTWSVPSGSLITSGQGTNSIEVTLGSNSGNVSVIASSNCGSSPASQFFVTVNPPTPAVPGVITGNTTVCPNTTGVQYSIVAVPNTTAYNWSVPAGATITAGQGTTTIQVTFGSASGNVSVTAGNSCGTSDPETLEVTVPGGGGSTIFSFTGAVQEFQVPVCVTSVSISSFGGQGDSGAGTSGRGGSASGTLAVTPGQTLYVYVGGAGVGNVAGFNGGGGGARAGGGASDVRVGGTALADRVIVAGGGGAIGSTGAAGGTGGGTTGGNGGSDGSVSGGSGGSQVSGGSGGSGANGNGGSGSLGLGGGGASGGGGGGGGYYGGGGGGRNEGQNLSSGGGGGSGFIGGVTGGTMSNGVRTGNGEVTISW